MVSRQPRFLGKLLFVVGIFAISLMGSIEVIMETDVSYNHESCTSTMTLGNSTKILWLVIVQVISRKLEYNTPWEYNSVFFCFHWCPGKATADWNVNIVPSLFHIFGAPAQNTTRDWPIINDIPFLLPLQLKFHRSAIQDSAATESRSHTFIVWPLNSLRGSVLFRKTTFTRHTQRRSGIDIMKKCRRPESVCMGRKNWPQHQNPKQELKRLQMSQFLLRYAP